MEKNIIIETDRLFMRKMTYDDIPSLNKILQDEKTMYAYEHAFSDEEVVSWLEKQMKNYETYGFGLFGMILRETGEFIGQCGITMQDFSGKSVPEIGYLLNRDFWHNGYATEAALAMKKYAFEVLSFKEVYSIIRDTNIASQNVAKRVGMKSVGEIVKHYYNMDMPHTVFSVKSPV